MEGLFIDVQLTPLPDSDPKQIMKNLETAIEGMKDHLIIATKVYGENRCFLVMEIQHAEKIMDVLNATCPYLKLESKPLLAYETFGRKTCGVEDGMLPEKKPSAKVDASKTLYYALFDIPSYQGKSMEELLQIWKEEAVTALSLVYGGEVPIRPFKVVGQRQVIAFLQMDAFGLDTASFTLPIMKHMGDQVHLTSKATKLLVDN